MTDQVRAEDLTSMGPGEIRAATLDGRMDALLGARPAPVVGLDPAEVDRLANNPDALAKYVRKVRAEAASDVVGSALWLARAKPAEIAKATRAGELDSVLRGDG